MSEPVGPSRSVERAGLLYALGAFLLWGFLPLYWKQLDNIPALTVLAHRFVWSFVFVAVLLRLRGRLGDLWTFFRDSGKFGWIALAAVLIAVNWGVYIWAVSSDHLLEASLGYYINPLVSVVLGVLVLGERLTRPQRWAIALAAAAVVLLAVELRALPWVSLVLAFSFGFYGLVKKWLALDALIGMAAETLILLPAALFYLIAGEAAHGWPLVTLPLWQKLMLLGAGVVTALPLLWFAEAANRIPLSTVGLIQYLTPTMKLIFGIFLYHEPFTVVHLISFALIWTALAVYTATLFRRRVG
ncbi:MAG: EamA family transporter RarD [Hydrogenibacillus sp.]|nr:EamA family transporter RarD [Hydrogenibacillus sp.]